MVNNNSKTIFAIIAGRPNAGKSSLLNAFVGEKIAAVSSKSQTTRTRITGIVTKDDTQFVFMDTPGIHKSKNKLSEHMNDAVNESICDVDNIIMVCDCTKPVSKAESTLIENIKGRNTKIFLALNKIDLLENDDELLKKLAEYSSLYNFDEIIPCSTVTRQGIDTIMEILEKNAIDGPHYFPDDALTDQPEKVFMSEIIREKALNNLSDEIPHGIAVVIESLKERDNKSGEPVLDIDATIYCERDSHKGIIIGKGGSMLKKIASQAREELEAFFQIKVNLKCWVKVKEGWRNREALIKNFGLSSK
ncbi:MAG: GTPase Era [Oscillospiraceae bacterium]